MPKKKSKPAKKTSSKRRRPASAGPTMGIHASSQGGGWGTGRGSSAFGRGDPEGEPEQYWPGQCCVRVIKG